MRKIIIILIVFISIICSSNNVNASEDDTNAVIFLEAKIEEDIVIVEAELVENEGVFALTLELDYNKNVFEFLSCDFKDALSKLEPIMTNNPQNQNSIIINWMSADGSNDYSKGDLLVLTFKLKDASQTGDYEFNLTCGEGNLVVLEDHEIIEKDIVIRAANISLIDKSDNIKLDQNYCWLIIPATILFVSLITLITLIVFVSKKHRKEANNQ